MSAVDNKHLIEIIAVNKESGIAKRTGNPWEMHKAQCVVRGPGNSVQIGELILPKDLANTTPGTYLAEFELAVSFERIVVPRITVLHPHGKTTAVPAPQKQAA
ncbi:MAG: hypothetical protein Q7T66_10365 [Herminiimonas sp.]|uniref:hypothetical protein n=1 Tax=Herminiimonas sp. TaxID=1926289 RepID=UPI002722B210|nr:hypothetical protein [Herminiimonas sp.]MDO9421056.1 hypothetical protein [Herminiimonas sp.]